MSIFVPNAETYTNPEAMAKGTVKGTEGRLLSLSLLNLNPTSARYLLLFDQPDTTKKPLDVVPAYADAGYTVLDEGYFTSFGETYSNGIYWVFSSNPNQAVEASGVDCILHLRYL